MRNWIKIWREKRAAKAEAHRAAVAALADQLTADSAGDVRNAFWAAKHALAGLRHGSPQWRLTFDAGEELNRRIGRPRRAGPDTATRMLYGD